MQNLLIMELDLARDHFDPLHIDHGQLIELAVSALEKVVALRLLRIVKVVPDKLALAVLLVLARDPAAVDATDAVVHVAHDQKELLLLAVVVEQRHILNAHMLQAGQLTELVDHAPLTYVHLNNNYNNIIIIF